MALRLLAAALVGGAALLVGPALASAAPITFNFADCSEITGPPGFLCPNQDSGKTTLTYRSDGLSITTSGYAINSTTGKDLYVKVTQGNPIETGLGIAVDPNHEINAGYVVDLDVIDLVNHGIKSGDLTLASLQTGEYYRVCLENTVGQADGTAVNCRTGTGGNIVTVQNLVWDGTYRYIAITSPGPGNVLVASELVVAPEPGTMALFATGMTGFALIRRRFGVGPRS